MPRHGKSRIVGDGAALRNCLTAQSKYSTDRPQPLPPNLLDLGQEGIEIFVPIIRDSMTPKGSPYRVTVDPERSDAGGTWVRVDHCGTDCELYVKGWILSSKITVADLYKAFAGLFDGDPDTDAVVANLSNRKQARVLLRDPALRREAVEAILSERQTRDAICLHFMHLLEDPANLIGQLPADVEIYIGTIEPSGKVKH